MTNNLDRYVLRGDTLVKDILEGRIKGKKCKWKTTMQNTRLDEEMGQFERDGTVSNHMEKLVPKTCPFGRELKERRE